MKKAQTGNLLLNILLWLVILMIIGGILYGMVKGFRIPGLSNILG